MSKRVGNPPPPPGAQKPEPPPSPPPPETPARPGRFCAHCGRPSGRHRFCSPEHEAAWYSDYRPHGTVRSVKRLSSGRVAVLVHFDDMEAERAFRFDLGDRVELGEAAA